MCAPLLVPFFSSDKINCKEAPAKFLCTAVVERKGNAVKFCRNVHDTAGERALPGAVNSASFRSGREAVTDLRASLLHHPVHIFPWVRALLLLNEATLRRGRSWEGRSPSCGHLCHRLSSPDAQDEERHGEPLSPPTLSSSTLFPLDRITQPSPWPPSWPLNPVAEEPRVGQVEPPTQLPTQGHYCFVQSIPLLVTKMPKPGEQGPTGLRGKRL